MRVLESFSHSTLQIKIPFGPFNFHTQRRWKKPVISAQTRLEDRTRDPKLDHLAAHLKTLNTILLLHRLMSNRKRGPFVSLQFMSRWRNIVGLNTNIGAFIHKYPHFFDVFTHPARRNLCCRITRKLKDLVREEQNVTHQWELEAVRCIKKLLMMSVNGTLSVHALRLIRKELGLPEDFRDSILRRYPFDFKLIELDTVELVNRDENLGVAQIEKWRQREYKDKWLSQFETRYAFPINLPTGFKIERGFRENLKNWQRLSYSKPYERRKEKEVVRGWFEKRVVGALHELLSLTVEKMVEVEKLAHFRRDLGLEVNVRELLLKHPGIFYISTKGNTQRVFLREAYSKGCLVERNPIYVVRRKMLELVLLGRRNTRELRLGKEMKEESGNVVWNEDGGGGTSEGDWVIPILRVLT